MKLRRAHVAACALLVFFSAATLAATAAAAATAADPRLTKASRHEKAGWIYLHVEGAPRDRGFQYGSLLASEIAEDMRVRRAVWEHETSMEWSWLVSRVKAFMVPKVDAENLAELDGLVEGLNCLLYTSDAADEEDSVDL